MPGKSDEFTRVGPGFRPMRSRTAHHGAEAQELQEHWNALLDAGLIGAPPSEPSPEIVAQRKANDALFRSFPHNQRKFWAGYR